MSYQTLGLPTEWTVEAMGFDPEVWENSTNICGTNISRPTLIAVKEICK